MTKRAASTKKKQAKRRSVPNAATAASKSPPDNPQAARLIDACIAELGAAEDGSAWRSLVLARVRSLIKQALPGVVEQWKWGVPVWAHPAGGIICTGETYKKAVKLTFAKGAQVPDPAGLFNSSLEGRTRRAIDIHQGESLDPTAFMALIRAAAKLSAHPKQK